MRERTNPSADRRGRPHPIHRHPVELERAFHGRGGRPSGHGRRSIGPDAGPERGPRGERGDREHGPFGHHGPRGMRHQVRRGMVREALLRQLADGPTHGYQLMQDLSERSGGRWRPSAGSIYPTLQQLEDEGLIAAQERDGRRVFDLTDAGRAAVEQLTAERPWSDRPEAGRDLHRLAREVGMAALQVSRMGTTTTVDAAATILTTARRDLYRLLADDPSPEATPVADAATDADDASDADAATDAG